MLLSGTATSVPTRTLNDSDTQRTFDIVAAEAGCAPPTGSGPGSGPAHLAVVQCLRRVPAQTLLRIQAKRNLQNAWSPAVDEAVLLEDPRVSLAAGRFARHVPTLAGLMADDGSLFVQGLAAGRTEAEYAAYLQQAYPPRLAAFLLKA